MQKAVQRVRKTAGVNFCAHDFRRTVASMMASSGVPRLTISKILNHVETGITAVYDRHSYDKEKREALHAWSRQLIGIVSKIEGGRQAAD
jgi:integrase